MELRPSAELAGDWELVGSGRVAVRNQFFERVAAGLVRAYVTEAGLLSPADMKDKASLLAAGQPWDLT
jgi:translation initiation factor 2B subunit (eIF-2B alpha/beta/delta family)